MAIKLASGIKLAVSVLPDPMVMARTRLQATTVLGLVDEALPEEVRKLVTSMTFIYRPSLELTMLVPDDVDLPAVQRLLARVREVVAAKLEAHFAKGP